MKRRTNNRGAYRKVDCVFIGAWIPSELMTLVDDFVRSEDLDRSKMIRRALEEKIREKPEAA
jgi:metal-responsive CopG/Arc/MetJ family transcriptional regulator